MKLQLSTLALAVAFAFASAAQAQTTQTPKRDTADKPPMVQADPAREARRAEEQSIAAAAKADRAKCDGMKANAKDICMAEAKGKEKVAKAELDAKHAKDKIKAEQKVKEVKAEAAYDVASQKCDDQKGEAKDACIKQAKVERDRAKGKAEKTADAKRESPAGMGGTAAAKPKQADQPKQKY